MEFKLVRFFSFVFITLLMLSCIGDADLTGFIRSTDRIEDRFALSMDYNSDKTHIIEVASDFYDLMVCADIHIGDTTNYNTFLKDAISRDVAAMVLVGDIVSGKKEDYDLLERILATERYKPSFVLTGNHELYFDGWKHFSRIFGSSIYYFTVQTPQSRDLYICLDSGSATLGKSQLKWLRNLLESSRNDYRYCVVFTHNNLFRNRFTLSTNPPENEVIVLMDLFLEHRVDMVVTGHDHIRAINPFGNTIYLTLDALADYHFNASYLKINVAGRGINYQFIETGNLTK